MPEPPGGRVESRPWSDPNEARLPRDRRVSRCESAPGRASALRSPLRRRPRRRRHRRALVPGRRVRGRATASRPWATSTGAKAKRRIDATRLVVAPGFIDMLGQSEYNVLVDTRAASKITQGITTEITGEGASIAPTNARMIAEGKEAFEHYGVTPGLHDPRRLLRKAFARARPPSTSARSSARAACATWSIGRERPPGHARRARGDGGGGGPGHGGGRLRPLAPRSCTCPTASPRPRRSSPSPRWPRRYGG